MAVALVCSRESLDAELERTVLWRLDIERHYARTFEEARGLSSVTHPDIVVVDRDIPGAEHLVGALRMGEPTRQRSILVVARDEAPPLEAALLRAGANAVLRLPAGPEWDARLIRLIRVPVRKHVRFLVSLQVRAGRGGGEEVALAVGRNLSATGMLLDCKIPLTTGEELDLEVQLPSLLVPSPITGRGRVVRHSPPTYYGLEFRYLEPGGRERVREFLAGLEEPEPGTV
jgi:hypothetical protein